MGCVLGEKICLHSIRSNVIFSAIFLYFFFFPVLAVCSYCSPHFGQIWEGATLDFETINTVLVNISELLFFSRWFVRKPLVLLLMALLTLAQAVHFSQTPDFFFLFPFFVVADLERGETSKRWKRS